MLNCVPAVKAYQVGGHDDDGVGEADCATFGICEATIIQHSQEDVHHFRVGFFYFVQQHNAVGSPPDCL